MNQLLTAPAQPLCEWKAETAGFKSILSPDDVMTSATYPEELVTDGTPLNKILDGSYNILLETFGRIAEATGVGFETLAKHPELTIGADQLKTEGIDPAPRLVVDEEGNERMAENYGEIEVSSADGVAEGGRILRVILRPKSVLHGMKKVWAIAPPQVFFFDPSKNAIGLRVWGRHNSPIMPLTPTWYDALGRYTGYTQSAIDQKAFEITAQGKKLITGFRNLSQLADPEKLGLVAPPREFWNSIFCGLALNGFQKD